MSTSGIERTTAMRTLLLPGTAGAGDDCIWIIKATD